MEAYVSVLLTFGALYALMGLGLNLQWGHTGLLNLGFVAFFAIGAYVSALLTLAGLPIPVGVIAAGIVAGAVAYPIGRVTLRLADEYFAIVTMGFAETVRILIPPIDAVGGAAGLGGIPPVFGWLSGLAKSYAVAGLFVAIVAIVLILLYRLTESPYGRTLRAIADAPEAAWAIGKNVIRFRIVTLVIGSVIAGFAGSLYAHYLTYISPTQFNLSLTFLILTGVAVGGSNHIGAALGTVVFVALVESTRFLSVFGLDVPNPAYLRLFVAGAVLIAIMQTRRQGLWPYTPKRRPISDA